MMMFVPLAQVPVRTVMIPMLTNCLSAKLMEESDCLMYLMTVSGPDITKDHCKTSKNTFLSDTVFEAILCNLNPCLRHNISNSKGIITIINLNFNNLFQSNKLRVNIIQITIRINLILLPIKLLLILVQLLDRLWLPKTRKSVSSHEYLALSTNF